MHKRACRLPPLSAAAFPTRRTIHSISQLSDPTPPRSRRSSEPGTPPQPPRPRTPNSPIHSHANKPTSQQASNAGRQASKIGRLIFPSPSYQVVGRAKLSSKVNHRHNSLHSSDYAAYFCSAGCVFVRVSAIVSRCVHADWRGVFGSQVGVWREI